MSAEIAPHAFDPRPLAIAKLMLAVAWVEGQLNRRDILVIQAYLDESIRMNEEDKHKFHLYQEYAIEPMERRRLARRFAQHYNSFNDRQELVNQLESLLPENGEHLNKTIAIQEIKEALVEDQINFIKKVQYKITRTPFPSKISDFGREAYLNDYKLNPIFFRLKLRFGDSFRQMGMSAKSAEKLSLDMAFVGLVIYADQILLPEELGLCTDYLETNWNLSEKYTELLITMALCRESHESQIPAFCHRYKELSSYDERHKLYMFLGEMARVDRHITKSEQHVLELIANGLEIPAGVRRSVMEQAEAEAVAVE